MFSSFFGGQDPNSVFNRFQNGPTESFFQRIYSCYPVSFVDRADMEKGNKILLPPSALESLARMSVSWPMLFEVINVETNSVSHCGVLEFTAEEGHCYMPYWMMRSMILEEGGKLKVTNCSLPKGTYVKLQPVTKDFLDISNPKAVLENSLRNFACLTIGDSIAITYLGRTYEIEIVDLKPGYACSIIETDIEVDFAPAKDYVEPKPEIKNKSQINVPPVAQPEKISADQLDTKSVFHGKGIRLDGRAGSPVRSSLKEAEPENPEPWLDCIPHGVRTTSAVFAELIAKGKLRKVDVQRSAEFERNQKFKLFSGGGRTCE